MEIPPVPVVIGIVIGTSSGAQTHSSPQTLQLNQAPSPATATSAARTQPAIPGGSGSLVALLLCCILALSAHSPHAIQGWTGGTRIAIHSTPEVASIGEAASHGCVRVTLAEGQWLLDHMPLGTPTLIST